MRVLVVGGAGYIGSHMSRALSAQGHEVDVLDNLSTGHREAVRWGPLHEVDLRDASRVEAVLSKHRFDAVMHFGALSIVKESISDPYAYYQCNVTGTANLLRAMQLHGPDKLVFSSSAAIYGEPCCDVIHEEHPKIPINPYGATKLTVERILADASAAYGLRSTALRYFNAAGATPDGEIGESHQPESHLIPNALRAALGQGPPLQVFGDDYPTPDGTCVRDFIHVEDLVEAHMLALNVLRSGAVAFNLGNGQGFSVREVIAAVGEVTGLEVPHEISPRRLGDPAVLVATSRKARRDLGWRPAFSSLHAIIETAWKWHRAPRY